MEIDECNYRTILQSDYIIGVSQLFFFFRDNFICTVIIWSCVMKNIRETK